MTQAGTTTIDTSAMASLRRTIDRALARPGFVLVVSGAGVSVESGIATYRGKDGLWTANGGAAMARAMAGYWLQYPRQSWNWHLAQRAVAQAAEPNAAHRALVDLETGLRLRFRLVTQNVDRLHLRAGNSAERTVEIHGHLDGMRCSAGCSGVMPVPSPFDAWQPGRELSDSECGLLTCARCGSIARPHTLGFDEFYDEENYHIHTACSWATRSSLVLTVGTSGGVRIAHRIAGIAQRSGAAVVDINPHDNELRRLALSGPLGVAIQAPAGAGVPKVVEAILAALPQCPYESRRLNSTGSVTL
jgi:NAD-dependent deacetylase